MKLIGEKIILRSWLENDYANYLNYHVGHHDWMDFNAPYFPKKSIDSIKQEIDDIQSNCAANEIKRAVIADISTNKLIGTVSWYWQCEYSNWKSIGIALYDSKYWGHGYGFEALWHWVDYLFEMDALTNRLDLRTWSGNTGMVKLAQKLNFKQEAKFREARTVNGLTFDGLVFGVLKHEWNLQYPKGFVTNN